MHSKVESTSHPGITYTHLKKELPLSVHYVKINPALCKVLPVRALDNGIGRECLTTLSKRYNALAAINGGYFQVGTSYDGLSIGAMKVDDNWYASPLHECSSIGWNKEGSASAVARMGVIWTLTIDGERLPIDNFNYLLLPGHAVLYSSGMHKSTLTTAGCTELVICDGRISEVHQPGGNSTIPPKGWVYSISADHPLSSKSFNVGTRVDINKKFVFFDEEFNDWERPPEIHKFWESCDYILSGGPVLIQDGKITQNFENDIVKTFILLTHQPRSAVGITKEGEWIFLIAEGRQPKHSLGMSVLEVAEFMHALGCVNALNLDGGASVLLMVEGKMVNEPMFNGIEFSSEEIGQRRISDAFIVIPR